MHCASSRDEITKYAVLQISGQIVKQTFLVTYPWERKSQSYVTVHGIENSSHKITFRIAINSINSEVIRIFLY